jgi:hypothetical protein
MVDFNSEGAFTANKSQILELVILGRRDELINAFQLWRENLIANTSKEEGLRHKLRAVLFALFMELDQPLKRKLGKKYDKLKEFICSTGGVDPDDLLECFFEINTALDEMNLIKIDNKKRYDTTSIESENAEKGL